MDIKSNPVRSRTEEMKIGKVTYIVTSHYKPDGRETAEQKYLKYVANRVAEELKNAENIAIPAI